jgi:hypothetical protein
MCWGRRHVGVAHAEIDDVGTPGAGRSLEAVDLGEHIGRQALYAVEFFDHVTTVVSWLMRKPEDAT